MVYFLDHCTLLLNDNFLKFLHKRYAVKSTKRSDEHRRISVRAYSYRSIIFTQALSVTAVVLLAVALVSAESVSYGAPSRAEAAPYLPSGWRPSGRQFLLPIRQNYDLYFPPSVYGSPTTTQQPTTTEQVTTTTDVPTTTEVRHCHKLSAAPVLRDRTPCRIAYRYQSAWCPSHKTETLINNALKNQISHETKITIQFLEFTWF
jgi:hypothetical protein